MALKIRLRQMGRTNRLMYRLVVTDSRSPRDGKCLEILGLYNPHINRNKNLNIVEDRVQYWINVGAKLTEKAEHLVFRVAPEIINSLKERRKVKRLKIRKKRNNKQNN